MSTIGTTAKPKVALIYNPKARGIAYQQNAVIEDLPVRAADQAIRMSSDSAGGNLDCAFCFQIPNQVFYVARDFVRVGPAESHIEVVILAEDPAIAQHVAAEEQLGDFARNH